MRTRTHEAEILDEAWFFEDYGPILLSCHNCHLIKKGSPFWLRCIWWVHAMLQGSSRETLQCPKAQVLLTKRLLNDFTLDSDPE